MKKILLSAAGVFFLLNALSVSASDKFDILPDLPEPLAAAQASSISTATPESARIAVQSVGAEPNILSVMFSLIFVILLIYATGIIYTKLNKAGASALKRHSGEFDASKVSVISTTPLGNNKSLHVVELNGKRMLIGASANGINLIKDLETCTVADLAEGEYSKIEIPNIRIPKIEIPKIEFPNIGFTKASKTTTEDVNNASESEDSSDSFEISDIYEESPDGIIDRLFTSSQEENESVSEPVKSVHEVDPEEYALYKKYL